MERYVKVDFLSKYDGQNSGVQDLWIKGEGTYTKNETLTLQDIIKQEILAGSLTDLREKICEVINDSITDGLNRHPVIEFGKLANAIIALLVQSQPNQQKQGGSKG